METPQIAVLILILFITVLIIVGVIFASIYAPQIKENTVSPSKEILPATIAYNKSNSSVIQKYGNSYMNNTAFIPVISTDEKSNIIFLGPKNFASDSQSLKNFCIGCTSSVEIGSSIMITSKQIISTTLSFDLQNTVNTTKASLLLSEISIIGGYCIVTVEKNAVYTFPEIDGVSATSISSVDFNEDSNGASQPFLLTATSDGNKTIKKVQIPDLKYADTATFTEKIELIPNDLKLIDGSLDIIFDFYCQGACNIYLKMEYSIS